MNATAKDVVNRPCSRWTHDAKAREEWADRGLASAAANMDKIVAQCRDWKCRLTVVVFPRPDQVATSDASSLQITYWREWAARNGVHFINAFPPFLDLPPAETIARYYLRGDIHFNEAGYKLLFDEVWKALPKPMVPPFDDAHYRLR